MNILGIAQGETRKGFVEEVAFKMSFRRMVGVCDKQKAGGHEESGDGEGQRMQN